MIRSPYVSDKMNPEAKKLWLEALESGQFQQISGVLRMNTTNAMCCLGVLCEVYRQQTGNGSWNDMGQFIVGDLSDPDAISSGLPKSKALADWAGIKRGQYSNGVNPDVYWEDAPKTGAGSYSLSQVNDNKRDNYQTVIRLIREQL